MRIYASTLFQIRDPRFEFHVAFSYDP